MYSSDFLKIQGVNTTSEGGHWIPITKAPHFVYGGKTYKVDKEWASRVIDNFRTITAKGYYPPIILAHKYPKPIDKPEDILEASEDARFKRWGRIVALSWLDGEGTLAAKVEWTPKALKEIEEGEHSYISPKYGATRDSNGGNYLDSLLEVSLVIKPHIKDIQSLQDFIPSSVSMSEELAQSGFSLEMKSVDDIDRKPTESMINSAKKVLRWKDDHGDDVKGMTQTGWTRANQIASGEPLSWETIQRISNFARHEKNKTVAPEFSSEPWKDNGYVAWLGWGGDSGILSWAPAKLDERDRLTKSMSDVNEEDMPEDMNTEMAGSETEKSTPDPFAEMADKFASMMDERMAPMMDRLSMMEQNHAKFAEMLDKMMRSPEEDESEEAEMACKGEDEKVEMAEEKSNELLTKIANLEATVAQYQSEAEKRKFKDHLSRFNGKTIAMSDDDAFVADMFALYQSNPELAQRLLSRATGSQAEPAKQEDDLDKWFNVAMGESVSTEPAVSNSIDTLETQWDALSTEDKSKYNGFAGFVAKVEGWN